MVYANLELQKYCETCMKVTSINSKLHLFELGDQSKDKRKHTHKLIVNPPKKWGLQIFYGLFEISKMLSLDLFSGDVYCETKSFLAQSGILLFLLPEKKKKHIWWMSDKKITATQLQKNSNLRIWLKMLITLCLTKKAKWHSESRRRSHIINLLNFWYKTIIVFCHTAGHCLGNIIHSKPCR